MKETKLVFQDDLNAPEVLNILASSNHRGYLYGYRVSESPKVIAYTDTYMDTPDLALSTANKVLRRRTDQRTSQSTMQLKTRTTSRGNDLRYETHEWRVGGAPPMSLSEMLDVLEVTLNRRQLLLTNGPDVVTLNLDEFLCRSLQSKRSHTAYEIELKSDTPRSGIDVLAERLKKAFGLIPIRRSKMKRALSMLGMGASGSRKPVILDMDPGVDDALALLLAFRSSEIEVLGVTTVGGNVDARQTTWNARRLTKWAAELTGQPEPEVIAGLDPVTPGADASDVHGEYGCGTFTDAVPDDEPCDQTAADWIAHSLDSRPGEITIVTTGPLTNLADCATRHPDSLAKAKEIVSMGGVFFDAGNRSQRAEFNIHRDPDSAKKVVEFCRELNDKGEVRLRLTLIGLDVTHQVRLPRASLARATESIRQDLESICHTYMDFYFENEGLDGCYLHDPLAVAYVIDPALCEVDAYHVEVETLGEFTKGETVVDFRPTRIYGDSAKEVTWLAIKVDAAGAEALIHGRIL